MRRFLVHVGLWFAYLSLFLGGAALLGPPVDSSALTPGEPSASLVAACLVAAIDVALLGAWISRARARGWRAFAEAAVVLYGVKTFSSQLEVAWFVTAAHVPTAMLPRLFSMTLPLCVIWPALAVWALAPREPGPVDARTANAPGALFAGMAVYPVLFFTFGYFVAWRVPEVRAYYGGPEVPLPFLAHLAGQLGTVPFEMFRGLLWIAIGWPVLRATRGPWWVGTALFAAMLALVQNDVHFLPNPLMPATVRHWHFVETASSNAIFAVIAGWLGSRPSALRRAYEQEAAELLARPNQGAPVHEEELATLPPAVATYLRRTNAVGRPRTLGFRATLRGRMRSAPNAPWMPAEVEMVERFDPPARLFFLRATRAGVPFEAFHRYVGPHATFRVKVAGLVQVVDAAGPEMDRSETVTLLNDLCLLAPSALLDADVRWDGDRVTLHHAGQTVSARLTFDSAGDLTGFVSEDRSQTADGTIYHRFPWSTPVTGGYREYGGTRLAAIAEARWREPAGEWTYADFELVSLA